MTRSNIISIIIILSLILLAVAMFHGIKIGKLEILSISEIKEKNNDLNKKIDKVSELVSKDYPQNVDKLSKTFNDYTITKEKYEQLSGITSEDKVERYETKQYDISYLWKVLGNYAEEKNLTLGVDVQQSNKGNALYSFKFSVSGEYVKIIEFIKILEDDSDLHFRIYDFKISGSGTRLSASFTVENINIDPSTIKGAQNRTTNLFEGSK